MLDVEEVLSSVLMLFLTVQQFALCEDVLPAIKTLPSLEQCNCLEISFDFMQIMDEDGADQKLMGDFGKHYKLLSAGLINS